MFSWCWLQLQLGVSLLHRWDLVDPKCCLCLCQVQGPGGYSRHFLLQQTKPETQATSVCPGQKCQLRKEGIINLSHFSMGSFAICLCLSGAAEPSLGLWCPLPSSRAETALLGPLGSGGSNHKTLLLLFEAVFYTPLLWLERIFVGLFDTEMGQLRTQK